MVWRRGRNELLILVLWGGESVWCWSRGKGGAVDVRVMELGVRECGLERTDIVSGPMDGPQTQMYALSFPS